MSNSLKQVATKGVLWSSIERFSVQGIQFVIMIIMARLLTPEDYGLVGMPTFPMIQEMWGVLIYPYHKQTKIPQAHGH